MLCPSILPVTDHMESLATAAVHAGRDDLTALGVHVPSLDASTTYPLPSIERGGDSYEVLATGGHPVVDGSLVYQRLWNPNVDRFERAVAQLEDADEAVAFATGMAAISAVLLAAVAAGTPHVVAVRPLYGGTDHLLATGLLGTRVTWAGVDEIADAIEADTGLVVLESPGNPTLDLVDIAAVVRAAGDVPVMVDNTFATPVLQQPLALGATLSVHSATKFMGGHGDLMGGVVACDGGVGVAAASGARHHGGTVVARERGRLHRGLQTLPIRVKAQQEGARSVAEWLLTRGEVDAVMWPGLPQFDVDGIAARQMAGPGSVLAFGMADVFDAAAVVTSACRLIVHAVSLGGVDTLIQHPAALTHRPVEGDAKPSQSVLRLSVGLEDPTDLIADLTQAFDAVHQRG